MNRIAARFAQACVFALLALLPWVGGGCSKGDGEAGQRDGARQGVKAGVTAAELQAELKVPHLWLTLEGVTQKKGKISLWVHVERAGGLRSVSIDETSVDIALGQLALRTRDGEPVVLVNRASRGLEVVMMPPRSQQVEDGGLDFDIHPFWEEGSVERWKARATRSSAFPDGTWLRYYISANIICADEEVHRMVDVPFLGVGLVRFNEDKDEGSASRQEEANTMSAGKTLDLGEGITVPCLWATIEDMRPQNWHMAMKIHLDKRGGLGPLRVSRTDLERAAAGVQLRTKEGDPVWSQQALRSVELRVPPADPQDYVTVPDGVLDLNVKGQFEEGLRYSEPMALDDPRGPPSVLPQGSILRYYLCGEVSCRTEGMGKAFYVPLMGVGLVQYGPKAE